MFYYNYQLTKESIYNVYDKFAALTLLRWSDRIISLNTFEKKRYLQIGISEDKIIIISNAAENSCFDHIDRRNTAPFVGDCSPKPTSEIQPRILAHVFRVEKFPGNIIIPRTPIH